jgi:hypothetical protein
MPKFWVSLDVGTVGANIEATTEKKAIEVDDRLREALKYPGIPNHLLDQVLLLMDEAHKAGYDEGWKECKENRD